MSRSPREELASEQAALARALVDAAAPVPSGFDETALADARRLLENKRRCDSSKRRARSGVGSKGSLRALGRALASPPTRFERWRGWWLRLVLSR